MDYCYKGTPLVGSGEGGFIYRHWFWQFSLDCPHVTFHVLLPGLTSTGHHSASSKPLALWNRTGLRDPGAALSPLCGPWLLQYERRLALQKDVKQHIQKKGLLVLPMPNWRSSSTISYSLAQNVLAVCRWCFTYTMPTWVLADHL